MFEVGPTQRPLAPQRRFSALLAEKKAEEKTTELAHKKPMSLAALRYCLQWFRPYIRRSVPGKGGVTWFLRIYGGGRRGFT